MPQVKFTREQLVDEFGLPYEENSALISIKEDKQTGSGRWSSHHALVFRLLSTGKCYRVRYRRGLTECQEGRPWEDEREITAEEVHEVPKTIMVWEAVRND